VAVVSVAGRYAAGEAWEALHSGLHVLLFSDNVSLEDEIELKSYAVDHGLLLMGPGAGTAILNGVALGFANVVPPGPVGIVSAAGTGLQEVSCLLARQGVGLTQGIGVGGRDLSEAVGGRMMLHAIRALQQDPQTDVLLLISKPPAAPVAASILALAASQPKPCVVCFLGHVPAAGGVPSHIHFAGTLEEAALRAARIARPEVPPPEAILAKEAGLLRRRARAVRSTLGAQQRYVRGLFSGGTLCYEAQVILRDLLSERVCSNAPLRPEDRLADSARSRQHTLIDLGEEEFTVGRPHPMIDNDLRLRRLAREAADPRVAVLLLDIVLGYGAHPDPAAELGPAVEAALAACRRKRRSIAIVASVTGTDEDPQVRAAQVRRMQQHGAIVCESNAAASRLAAWIVAR
jgi:FdrA protein